MTIKQIQKLINDEINYQQTVAEEDGVKLDAEFIKNIKHSKIYKDLGQMLTGIDRKYFCAKAKI